MRYLYYVHDPMCSWCWAFRPVWTEIVEALPTGVEPRRLLGGLAPDCDQPMPEAMRRQISGIWRDIERRVPGTRFNFDFWTHCSPRRSTYPACRAVIAARRQSPGAEEAMILAIQRAYYLEAKNPSEHATLIGLAEGLGLDGARFAEELNSTPVREALDREIRAGRAMGAVGFPSLVLVEGRDARLLQHDYLDAGVVLAQLGTART